MSEILFELEQLPSYKTKNNIKQNITTNNVLRYSSENTLKHIQGDIFVETDHSFLQDVTRIAKAKDSILNNFIQFTKQEITDEECDQIDFRASLHCQANIINTNTIMNEHNVDISKRCECGCKRSKGQKLSIFANLTQLQVLGPGVQLFFLYLKAIFICLSVVMIIYGIFSLYSNLSSNEVDISGCSDNYCKFSKRASDQNNKSPQLHRIQSWLGVGFSIVWVFLIRVLKYIGNKVNAEMDSKFKTASDLAIKIQNLPYGQYCQQQLIQYFNKLWNKAYAGEQTFPQLMEQKQVCTKYGVKSIQIVYNMEFSRKMIEEIRSRSVAVYRMLSQDHQKIKRKQTKIKNLVKEVAQYKIHKIKLIKTYQLLQDLRKKFLTDFEFRKNMSTTCCIIEFTNESKANQMLKKYGEKRVGLLKQIQQKIKEGIKKKCFGSSETNLFKGNVISIERAPEPSDLLWTNCQKKYSILRVVLIYFITFLIILISFGIVTSLDILQQRYIQINSQTDAQTLTFINFLTSISLMLINNFLWFSLFYLLELEYNHTLTDKIMSQMNKTLVASSINIIVLPIVSSYIIRNKFYGTDGVQGIVLDYHISLLSVGLIVRLINPIAMIKRVMIYLRWSRNLIIRFLYTKKSENQLMSKQVNKFYEGQKFDIADYYVTVTCAVYHAVFFVQLQPVIIFLVGAMVLGFYWVVKIKIVRFSKITEQTQQIVFQSALSQANLVPMMYGIGSITISYISYNINPIKQFSYLPPLLCISISLLAFINPFNIFNIAIKALFQLFQNPEHKTQQAQKHIISDYYTQSNSLTLLGFQCKLRDSNINQAVEQLKKFCSSFIPFNYESKIHHVTANVFQNIQTTFNKDKQSKLLSSYRPEILNIRHFEELSQE